MKVLIGCETSGVVRRAFAARGHDTWSCDLLPAEDRSNHHMICDVRDALHMGWDLLVVLHPPCTRLCNSGVRWLTVPPRNPPADATAAERAAWPHLDEAARLEIIWSHLEAGAAQSPIPNPQSPIPNPHLNQNNLEFINSIYIKNNLIRNNFNLIV